MILLQLLLALNLESSARGTAIGNGGDVVNLFLRTTLKGLKLTLKNLPKPTCPQLEDEPEMKEECESFLDHSREEFLSLLSAGPKIHLSHEPLYVETPHGRRRVAARTSHDAQGPIEIYYPTAKTLTPPQAARLLIHELGHKVRYLGGYIKDHDPIGYHETGRDLLDQAGEALSLHAQKMGWISKNYKLMDRFDCTIQVGSFSLNVEGMSPRRFRSGSHYDEYQVSIGLKPQDFNIKIPEKNTLTEVAFIMEITEKNSCQGGPKASQTKLSLIRRGGSEKHTLLSEATLNLNPLCPGHQKSIGLAAQDVRVDCSYTGSLGQD